MHAPGETSVARRVACRTAGTLTVTASEGTCTYKTCTHCLRKPACFHSALTECMKSLNANVQSKFIDCPKTRISGQSSKYVKTCASNDV